MSVIKNPVLFLLVFIVTFVSYCQTRTYQKLHPFSGTLVLSLEGGITIGSTDYAKSNPGGRFIGGIEYYLPVYTSHIFGIRGYGGGQVVNSNDNNKVISLPAAGQTLLPDDIKAEMYIAGLNLVYSYSIEDKYFPFISAGISNIWFSPKLANGSRAPRNSINEYNRSAIVYDFWLGFKYQVYENISINLNGGFHLPDTDYLDDVKTGTSKDFYGTGVIGVSYSLFTEKDSDGDGVPDSRDMCPDTPRGIEVDEFGCPIDSDGDGVPDYLDKCPNTSRGVPVDKDGCPLDSDGDGVPDYLDKCPDTPIGIAVDENGCPIDSDGDGIPDYLDKCPDTPAEVPVDEFGCPLDSDGDGVPDYLDKCPDTSPGIKVDEFGCPEDKSLGIISVPKEIIIEAEATFIRNKTDILPEAISELDRIVKMLQLYPEINWRIEGHTDRHEGDNLLVRPLSLRRAEAILNYFISKGLPSFQLRVYDMGDKFPIANNNTEYGRMKNRRVVLVREN